MLSIYLKNAARVLTRNKLYAGINIIGLAVGIACCLLILLHVQKELSFDSFHENRDRICRIVSHYRYPGGATELKAISGAAPGQLLAAEHTEIESLVRFYSLRVLVTEGDTRIYESDFFFADSQVFEVFSFGLKTGDPLTALSEPGSVVLTEEAAARYFGNDSPIGKVLTLDNRTEVTITGILEGLPDNSHMRFDFLASLSTVPMFWRNFEDRWDTPVWSYILLKKGSDPDALAAKFSETIARHQNDIHTAAVSYHLQPLSDIHLQPLTVEIGPGTDPSSLWLYGGIALLILIVGCINFVNLAAAQYARRMREVGMRKVLGASRGQLIRQFAVESALLIGSAAVLSVGLAELFLPTFNSITGTSVEFNLVGNWIVAGGLTGLAILLGSLTSVTPAFFMSIVQPSSILRTSTVTGGVGVILRRALVTFQFAVSAALILAAQVVYSQVNYMQSKDLGFESEDILLVPFERQLLSRSHRAIKSELIARPGVLAVTASSGYPGQPSVNGLTVKYPGSPEVSMNCLWVDDNYIGTLGLRSADYSGQFDDVIDGDRQAFLLNESALRMLGGEISAGTSLEVYAGTGGDRAFGYSGPVEGIVQDFHFRAIQNRISPAVMVIDPQQSPYRFQYLLVKLDPETAETGLGSVEQVYNQFVPDRPMEHFYLEDLIAGNYRSEKRFSEMFGYTCLLAIITALTGLFGLVVHMTGRRTKEIGIRRVLGASVSRIVLHLNRELLVLIVIANAIALPAARYFLSDWLNNYAYRINLDLWYFFAALATTIILATAAVGYHSLRSARANPVEALHQE